MNRRWISAGVGGLAFGAAALWFAGNAWVYRRLDPAPLPAMSPALGTTLSAGSCKPCHQETYEEWAGSKMGQAMTDPVFLADFALQGEPFICLRCHAPLIEQQERTEWGLLSVSPLIPLTNANPTFDLELQSEGVTCVVCHLKDEAMMGSLYDVGAPHKTHTADVSATCARCHQLEITPLSNLVRPITDTVREWERWKQTTGRGETCVDCHMPAVTRVVGIGGPPRTGHRHTWHGAWNDEMVRSGLRVEARRDGADAVVTLTNLAGHNLPSGDPARALVVRSGGYEAVLARRVPLPRLIDQWDTSLLPGETREIRLKLEGPVQVAFQRLRFLEVGVPDTELVLFDETL